MRTKKEDENLSTLRDRTYETRASGFLALERAT